MSNLRNQYFTAEHEKFRLKVREILSWEVSPFIDEWEETQTIPKMIWKKLGDAELLGVGFPQFVKGTDLDFFYNVIFVEELSRVHSGGFGASIGIPQLALPYMYHYGSDYIKQNYLAKVISGDKLCSIAITEPIAGSDVFNIRTNAKEEGDFYIVNGAKTFITNGYYADFYQTVVKTENGVSLLIIDTNLDGITKRKIRKMGWHASDTAEIGFNNVRVPKKNLLGEDGRGFLYLMQGLQYERLLMALIAVCDMQLALEYTLRQLKERAVNTNQNINQVTRHKLAELQSIIELDSNYVYRCCQAHADGEYIVKECSIAKLRATENANKVLSQFIEVLDEEGVDENRHLARVFRDSRIGNIGGGTSEIMCEIIAKMGIDDISYTKPI